MSDNAAREWRFYLEEMIGFAEKVIAYTDGLDQAAFVASGLNYDAIAVLPAPTFANNPDSKPLEFEGIKNRGWL